MSRTTPTTGARQPVEWLMLSAALLHLWEIDGHGRAWWGYGVFFTVIVVGQGLYSLLLPRYGSVRVNDGGKWTPWRRVKTDPLGLIVSRVRLLVGGRGRGS